LRRLDLQSLELRCLHVDLIWCYKVVFGLVDIDRMPFSSLTLAPQLVDTRINFTRNTQQLAQDRTFLASICLEFVAY